MWQEPTGPLPSPVYWRRRTLAVVVLVVALLALTWLAVALISGADEAGRPGADAGGQPVGHPSAAGAGPTGPAGPAGPVRGLAADRPIVAVSSEPSAGAATPPGPPGPAQPPPPGPPQPCPDEAIGLVARPERAEYRVGSKPVLTLTVVNTGQVACVRDLDARLQELLLLAEDGSTRLWSSNDCYPGDSDDVRTLHPGTAVTFSVTWAGRSSDPTCGGNRTPIGPGTYQLVPRLGPITGPPAPLRLVP